VEIRCKVSIFALKEYSTVWCEVTNEYPQPTTRKIMTQAITEKTVRVYLKGLRRNIGRILLSSEPLNLVETEKKAADVRTLPFFLLFFYTWGNPHGHPTALWEATG
jgi:hypothetical protein